MDRAITARPPLADAMALLRAADLPTEDLTDSHLEHFFMVGGTGSAVGLVGLELFGRHALLRSLVVDPQVRTTGLGSRLVEHAEAHARTERSTAPESIRGTREFASLCPTSSAFMVKQLSE